MYYSFHSTHWKAILHSVNSDVVGLRLCKLELVHNVLFDFVVSFLPAPSSFEQFQGNPK